MGVRKIVPAKEKRSKRVKLGGNDALAALLQGRLSVRRSKCSAVWHGQAPRGGQLSEKRRARKCFSAMQTIGFPGTPFSKRKLAKARARVSRVAF